MSNNKMVFPMTFTKCPACGSEKRIVETAMDEESPNRPANQKCALHMLGVALTSQAGALSRVTVPILMVLTDACVECGTIYITRIDKGIGTPQPQGNLPTPRPPFGGGRG